jgi:hypothetical protein
VLAFLSVICPGYSPTSGAAADVSATPTYHSGWLLHHQHTLSNQTTLGTATANTSSSNTPISTASAAAAAVAASYHVAANLEYGSNSSSHRRPQHSFYSQQHHSSSSSSAGGVGGSAVSSPYHAGYGSAAAAYAPRLPRHIEYQHLYEGSEPTSGADSGRTSLDLPQQQSRQYDSIEGPAEAAAAAAGLATGGGGGAGLALRMAVDSLHSWGSDSAPPAGSAQLQARLSSASGADDMRGNNMSSSNQLQQGSSAESRECPSCCAIKCWGLFIIAVVAHDACWGSIACVLSLGPAPLLAVYGE